MKYSPLCSVVLAIPLIAGQALAEPTAVPAKVHTLGIASGARSNPAVSESVVFSHVVDLGDVTWVRLRFGSVTLQPGSYLRITSLTDNDTQTLDLRALAEWQNSTAFFNGPAVRVELVAAPGTTGNSVTIAEAMSDDPDQPMSLLLTPTPRRVCSLVDTRGPSNNLATARLLSNVVSGSISICTGWITDRVAENDPQNRCMLTAGHCFRSPRRAMIAQFNVPPSAANCAINNPPAMFQFPIRGVIDREDAEGARNVAGRDWAAFICGRNNLNNTAFQQQGAQFGLAAPAVAPATKFGDGAVGDFDPNDPPDDRFCECLPNNARAPLNFTQTTASANITAVAANHVDHSIHTCGGDSGAPVVQSGLGVGVHTHGGCVGAAPDNSGTDVTKPRLQAALANCRCTNNAQCDDDNPCTTDTCTSVGGAFVCMNTPVQDGTPCVDDDPCTANETCVAGQCQTTDVCHFLCYEANKQVVPVTPGVSLIDQFESTTVNVGAPKNLCTPVNKNDEDPGAEDAPIHLLAHETKGDRFTRVPNLTVTDQFGTIVVDAFQRNRLLVPTSKSLTGTPPPPGPSSPMGAFLDHFQCYRVKRARGAARFTPQVGVTLVDQFQTTTVTVRKPRMLCAPVNKRNESPGAETHERHLMCYQVKSKVAVNMSDVPIFINNQFGPKTVRVEHREMLCVPATKFNPAATTTTTPTTSTTTTTLQTLCCDVPPGALGNPVPVCLDAVSPDVSIKCSLLGGTLSPVSFVCDPDLEQCVPSPPVPPSNFCCECPVPSPPFPHPEVCFEGVTGHEFKCQPPCVLHPTLTCGPVSERCGGSPSGAFLELRELF